MEPGHEVETPATDKPPPLPTRVNAFGDAAAAFTPLTAETLLRTIADTSGSWFPSRYAAETGLPRDCLDEPLAELRLADFIRVSEWVKGQGQGYVLTPEGEAAVKNPAVLEQWRKSSHSIHTGANADTETDSLALPVKVPLTKVNSQNGNSPNEVSTSDGSLPEPELTFRPLLVVPVLLIANALWFVVCAVWSVRWGLTPYRLLWSLHKDVLPQSGAVSGADILSGDWWRLLTSCFVHIGVIHLVGNLLSLAMMGPLSELLWGRKRLLLIYLISGLVGSSLAMTLRPDATLAGASGAIWGVLMSLFAWLFTFRRQLPPDLASDWFRRMTVVFVLSLGISFIPGISWEAHLGGGAAGFLTASLLNAARAGDSRRRILAWLLIALVPVVSLAGLGLAMDAKGMVGWEHLRQRLAQEHEKREREARKKKIDEAKEEYHAQVAPRLQQIAPHTILHARWRAGAPAVLFLSPESPALYALAESKRTPEQTAAAKSRVEGLKKTAEEAVQLSTHEPTGIEEIDRRDERAKAFAEARAKSFGLLLEMLASPEPPKAEAWEAWKASCREAERLWGELAKR